MEIMHHINTLTDANCLNIIYLYILIYVENVHNYFHDFRRHVKYATLKIDIARRKWSEFETPPNATSQHVSSLLSTTSMQPTHERRLHSLVGFRRVRSGERGG